MSIFIIASTEDPAGTTIKQQLIQHGTWDKETTYQDEPILHCQEVPNTYLITINDRTIYHDNLDKELTQILKKQPSLLIFLSRHTSKMGKPTLAVHPIGNYNTASFGGKPHTLVPSAPYMMTNLLRKINTYHKKTPLHYQVCFEVTHHGPYLETPTLFVEVGSTPTQWIQKLPAQIIAKAIYNQITSPQNEQSIPTIIGIGGGHYAPRFTDIALEKQVAFGHMIPAYHIDAKVITTKIVAEAIQKTPQAEAVYIHSKGLKKPQIRQFKDICKTLDIPVISSKQLPALS
ncbi:MAG: hypothetical protein KKC68_08845 [Candidatus Thermoplasmatota archaeon]|nr:hypothetical protein [Candidatus Thermoplasmatota archaeon]